MKSAIFFSGTHGVGETTTINSAAKEFGAEIFRGMGDDHRNPCEKDIFNRQAYRLGKYFSDAIHIQDIVAHKNELIFVDRCIYDWIAYTETFKRVGWLSEKECAKLMKYKDALFEKDLVPQTVVWLDPPYGWTRARILERWNEEKKKWKEDDFEYLEELKRMYGEIYGSAPMPHLLRVEETDQGRRLEIIKKFLKEL